MYRWGVILMLKCPLSAVAEGAAIDARSNALSIFAVVEEIQAQGFPLFLPKLVFVTLWHREPDDADRYPVEFIVTENEKELLRSPGELNFRGKTRNRQIITIGGLVIPEPGVVRFTARIDGGPEATFALQVSAAPQIEQRSEVSGVSGTR